MKSTIRSILRSITIAAVFCAPVIDGIRSSTSLSSLHVSDEGTTRRTLVNTRGFPRGGSSGNNNADALSPSSSSSVVSVVPDGTLPRAISGGESEADAEAPVANVEEEAPADPAVQSAKWRDLRNRVLSAVGMIGFLGGLSYYFKEDGLSALVFLLQAMMYGEMTRTIGGDDWGSIGASVRKHWWFLTAVVAWNGPKILAWKRTVFEATAFGMAISVGLLGSVLSFQRNQSGTVDFREFIRQSAVSLVSAVLVILPSSFWIGTLEEHGMAWIFVPAAFVAINDIMAYVFGRLFGTHPLLPSISPKKTWEGFLGAAVSTVGAAWVGLADEAGGQALLGPGLKGVSRFDGMVLATFASVVAPFAGFLASVIKRAYGRKDFGSIFPGHGGFVDRLDCQLVLAPFVYFYLTLYKAVAASS